MHNFFLENQRRTNNNKCLFLGLGQSSEKLEMFKQNFDKVQSEALASAAEDGLQDWVRDQNLLVRFFLFSFLHKSFILYRQSMEEKPMLKVSMFMEKRNMKDAQKLQKPVNCSKPSKTPHHVRNAFQN